MYCSEPLHPTQLPRTTASCAHPLHHALHLPSHCKTFHPWHILCQLDPFPRHISFPLFLPSTSSQPSHLIRHLFSTLPVFSARVQCHINHLITSLLAAQFASTSTSTPPFLLPSLPSFSTQVFDILHPSPIITLLSSSPIFSVLVLLVLFSSLVLQKAHVATCFSVQFHCPLYPFNLVRPPTSTFSPFRLWAEPHFIPPFLPARTPAPHLLRNSPCYPSSLASLS
jgi:hypothetical protein